MDTGITCIASRHSVAETLQRLESLLTQRGVMIFARIDFSGDAARAGLTLRPEQMLIFGNPRAGTPLMQSVPAAGLDLPQRWCHSSSAQRVTERAAAQRQTIGALAAALR